MHNIYYQFNYVDIPLLVVPSYIIYTAVAAVVDNEVDGLAMVFDVKPVAHIKPLSVNRKFFSFKYIVYYKRNEFFRKVIWPVIVRAPRNTNREMISITVRTYYKVGACL